MKCGNSALREAIQAPTVVRHVPPRLQSWTRLEGAHLEPNMVLLAQSGRTAQPRAVSVLFEDELAKLFAQSLSIKATLSCLP
jgi:hypothetical protein